MNIVEGKDMTAEEIRRWIEKVNKEFGLESKNEASQKYLMAIKDLCVFLMAEDMYAVLLPCPDMWGNMEVGVVSYYIVPEKRNIHSFLRLQKAIEKEAKHRGAKTIIQGSHLIGDRLFLYLKRNGYKVATMRKDL